MNVKVIGKRSGISKKSGKNYYQVFYVSKCINGEGDAGDSVFLDADEYSKVAVGKNYDAQFSRGGYLESFKPSV